MNKDNIEEILKKLGSEDVPADVRKIAEETAKDFSETQTKQPRHYVLWENIMRSRMTRLAAAAVIVVAVLIGMHHFGRSIESVALADVLERVEQVQAFMYKFKMNMTGNMQPGMPVGENQIEATVTISTGYGIKMDMDMNAVVNGASQKMRQLMYVLPEEKKMMYMIMPEQKQYIQMEFDESLLARMKKQSNDPREMLKQILNSKYTNIGKSVIDGVEVEGFETTDPAIAGGMMEDIKVTLWVDRNTKLPVREEIYYKVNEQMEMEGELYDFQWDAQVNADEFKPVIPEDYTTILPGGYKLPSASEEGAIEGLRFCEQLTGRYPKKIDMMNLMNEIVAITHNNNPTEAGLKLQEQIREDMNNLPDEEKAQKIMEIMRPVQALGMFHMALVQDGKEPAYYGDKVTDEFSHAVLMRWKTDNGNYKVIFADLTLKEVSPEELVELESAPLNSEPAAIKPQPADGAEGVQLSELQLSWMPGAYVTEHKVYFGTNADSLPLLTEVSDSCSTLAPALQRQMSYYWRVDEIQPDGSVVTGDIWSFDTGRLVAWWKLDDSTDGIAVDWSGNGNDGNLVGDTNQAAGIIGGAFQFDGDGDYVDIGNAPALNIANQITVSAWIKVDTFDSNYQAIITKGDSAWRLQRDEGKSNLEFACSGLDVPGAEWSGIFGSTDINDGQWHHAAGVYDGNMMCLYVDGEIDASSEASGAIQINNKPVYIGENAEKPGRCWNGLIDDVQIYNYALTSDEIAVICEKRTAITGH